MQGLSAWLYVATYGRKLISAESLDIPASWIKQALAITMYKHHIYTHINTHLQVTTVPD